MAALLARLQDDVKQAMKAGDALSRDTLRLVVSDIKKREVDEGRDLTAEEELAVLQKAVKSREDSVAQYGAAGRTDLVEREQGEIAVIRRYLPTQLSEPDTAALVEQTIATPPSRGDVAGSASAAEHRARHHPDPDRHGAQG
jgi:uncharacterized protein YqeY